MSQSKSKLFRILFVFAVLAMASMACNDPVTPGDGQVGEAVMDGYNGIRDTASAVQDAVEGESLEIETHESPLSALWGVAKEVHSTDQYNQCLDACEDTGCERNCEILWLV